MKKIKLALTTVCIFTICMINAQTSSSQPTNSPSLKDKAEKANISRKKPAPQKSTVAPSTSNVSGASTINENDTYQGRKQEFEKLFITNTLPMDFPTYHTSYGIRGYNQMIDSYCVQHLDLLVDKVKQKITGHL